MKSAGFKKLRSDFRWMLLAGVAACAMLSIHPAFAESTTAIGTVTVDGETDDQGTGLYSAEEQAPKARSTVTEKYIEEQPGSYNPFQLIEKLPGVNTTSVDSTGLYGGSLSVRGFTSSQMGFTLDGIPLNDSGAYGVYPHEYIDKENLSSIFLAQGYGDTDKPNLSATGGNIDMFIRDPMDKFNVNAQQSFGSDSYWRSFARVDTGEFLNGTKAFFSYSKSEADKFRGEGRADREHFDTKIVKKIASSSQISFGAYYNKSVNNNFRSATLSQIDQYGWDFDYATTFDPRPTPVNGTAQSDDNSYNNPFSREQYYKLRVNPWESLILSAKANLQVADNVRLDFEPYFVFGRGNGGGAVYLKEGDTSTKYSGLHAIMGTNSGVDLNGDGDTLDTVLFYRPSNARAFRPGFVSRLTWNFENNVLSTGFQYERARLREIRQYVYVDAYGNPSDVWATNPELFRVSDGLPARVRDTETVSTIKRPFIQDSLSLFNDQVTAEFGLQYAMVDRDGTNNLPLAQRTYSGGVIVPVHTTQSNSKLMPNAGLNWRITPEHQLFVSAAQSFRAPDNTAMFEPGSGAALKPETAVIVDGGYRYAGSFFSGGITAFNIDYKDRQQSSKDLVTGITVAKTIGDVQTRGVELEVATKQFNGFSAYASASYTDSKLQDNTEVNGTILPTSGKNMIETPKYLGALVLRYDGKGWFTSVAGKYTGSRYSTLMNDESVAPHKTVDVTAGYDLPASLVGLQKVTVVFAVDNVFDERYLGTLISYTTNATGANAGSPTYQVGGPRFASVSLSVDF